MLKSRFAFALTPLFLIAAAAAAEPTAGPLPGDTPAAATAQTSPTPALPAAAPSTPPSAPIPARPSYFLQFHGGFTSGRLTAAAHPKEVNEHESMREASGYMMGVGIEGDLSSNLRWFFDGTTASQKLDVASEGGYASGDWIFEERDYAGRDVGPFTTDVNAVVRGTGFRAGAKYFVGEPGGLRPWAGAGYGFYTWSYAYLNSEETKTYGKAKGSVTGLTVMGGVNYEIDTRTVISVYADLMSPAVFPKIENLFNTGWTWENSGGTHIMGPFRLGAALQFAM
ncbi:MAG: hypothetical protein NDJ90_06945 [Oligoflexia bacterium]|nr:hypothetical protein [Oligoflexia bacterium]